ncbi:hypothetical protein Sste5346_001331 [Sporothrix stenoceras]|uniref:MOSC domain-containing protein n=1 Tax=Sporothrix stenoceras TaxID=5173 RepID=A0ABR3ZRD2_9PEZI
MKVTGIYVYPVKALRGIALPTAELGAQGIRYDRRFMILTTKRSKSGQLQKMQLSSFPECALFSQEMTTDEKGAGASVIVHYHPPEKKHDGIPVDRAGAEKNRIIMSPVQHPPLQIPLDPSIRSLKKLDVDLHGSHAKGYRMGDKYDAWFSACFGFDVVLVYIGDGQRKVLGETLKTGVTVRSKKAKATKSAKTAKGKSVPSVTDKFWPLAVLELLAALWLELIYALGIRKKPPPEKDEPWLTFSDCAPFLVTAESSLRNVRARMSEGVDVPMYKFRPNIVVDGDGEEEWAEDYWGELTVRPNGVSASASDVPSLVDSRASSPGSEIDGALTPKSGTATPVKLLLTSNCARCTSLNVDYKTGTRAAGELGELLGRLAKDRRVDPGTKYSPVFGRYAFLDQRGSDGEDEEEEEDIVRIAVGDEVTVTRRNAERTVWDWPDL